MGGVVPGVTEQSCQEPHGVWQRATRDPVGRVVFTGADVRAAGEPRLHTAGTGLHRSLSARCRG